MIQHSASSLETAPRRRRFARIGSLATALAATALLALGTASPANAAGWHTNTDPYSTGCANSKNLLSTKAVSGGTARVYWSSVCGTNWVEYSGINQWVKKRTFSNDMNYGGSTQWENDLGAWSYSMQVYAPGTTYMEATVIINGKTTKAVCGVSCKWY